jgi:hypothetical protein
MCHCVILKNNLNDKCTTHLANSLKWDSTIKVLNLQDLKLTTPHGWQYFSACYMLSPIYSVERIDMRDNNIADEGPQQQYVEVEKS